MPAGEIPLFIGASGFPYSYAPISNGVRNGTYRAARGKPLREQLEIIGVLDEFDGETTPAQLPYSLG